MYVKNKQREKEDTKGGGLLFQRMSLRSLWNFKGGEWNGDMSARNKLRDVEEVITNKNVDIILKINFK